MKNWLLVIIGLLFFLLINLKFKSNIVEKFDYNNSGTDTSSLYTSILPRSIYTKEGRLQNSHWANNKNPKSHDPPCLTKTPYGNAMAMYYYWKYLPNLLEKQYESCDKYKCANQTLNGYNAIPNITDTVGYGREKMKPDWTLSCSTHPDYYNSPERFCEKHPEHYPCANWWMKNPEQIKDITVQMDLKCLPKKMPMLPKVARTKNNLGFCLANDPKCNMNDGGGLLMIQRHREDRALC